MDCFQIVNGSQLPNQIDRKVSVIGYVNSASMNALTFELRATDNVMIKVNLKRPLDRPIEGYVEVSYTWNELNIYWFFYIPFVGTRSVPE